MWPLKKRSENIDWIHVVEFRFSGRISWGNNGTSICITWFLIISNKMQLFFYYLFLKDSTCFGRFLRPSSGTHNCTFSFRYCQPVLLQAGIEDEMELNWSQFHLMKSVSSISWSQLHLMKSVPSHEVSSFSWSQSHLMKSVPSHEVSQFHLMKSVPSHEVSSISWSQFHLTNDTSLQQYGLTSLEAECTVMCFWWWVEEPFRNK